MRNYFCIFIFLLLNSPIFAKQIWVVSTQGEVNGLGTLQSPLKTIEEALLKAKQSLEKDIVIELREGTYYLTEPLIILSSDFKSKSLTIKSYNEEDVVISGGYTIKPNWKKSKKGYWVAAVDKVNFDQMFLNGKKQVLARYPNYVPNVRLNGSAIDAFSTERIRGWKNPKGGYIHALHIGEWGGMHYEIKGVDGSDLILDGGFQNNRPSKMHPKYRFVENIFEEMDAPNEWFLNKNTHTLYYYPENDQLLKSAHIEVATLPQLIILKGDNGPLKNVKLEGITFSHTARTFMQPYEQLMRSDWCIYRGAALFMENTESCVVEKCEFTNLGGNALFISRYNMNASVRHSHFHHIGASAICLVGDTSAARSGVKRYEEFVPLSEMDLTPGPANALYPRQCIIEDNLIHHIGEVEKQVAGVQIELAAQIRVAYNTIYQVPRSAINVGDGAFGGHIIEYNDAFETVLETSDHGAFNSWGRDRFWLPNYKKMCELVDANPNMILLDACYTTIIRNNRFSCNHGWDIDLDDGSSNYHIYNNICLSGGIKLREGFYRKVENNITINNSLHPHVWFKNSGDVIRRNIFMRPYYPIALQSWGEEVDYNYFSSETALSFARTEKLDLHGLCGELQFVDASSGDYSLPLGSKAFKIGFENIPMDQFGVYSCELKSIASKPIIPQIIDVTNTNSTQLHNWLKAKVRFINGLGDRSAYGLPDEKGVIVVELASHGVLSKSGIQQGDVIRSVSGELLNNLESLFIETDKNRWKGKLELEIFRNQTTIPVQVYFK